VGVEGKNTNKQVSFGHFLEQTPHPVPVKSEGFWKFAAKNGIIPVLTGILGGW